MKAVFVLLLLRKTFVMQNNIDSNQKKMYSHGPNHLIKYHGYKIEKNIKNMIVSELTVN